MKRIWRGLILAVSVLPLAASAQDAINPAGLGDIIAGRPYSPYADRAFPTQVYFGDTHAHTALSADAGGGGTRLLPRDSYRFARGEQVISNTGQPVKLARPFDFYMITDYSDGMGAITDIIGGAPAIMADPQGAAFNRAFNAGGTEALRAAQELTRQFAQGELPEALNYQPGNPAYRRIWLDIIQAAEEFNDPGVFTTFIAYEWTSLVSGNNLHRNVIFRDGPERAGQVEPYTTTPPIGSRNPRDLWAWLQMYEDTTGGDVPAIPHNGNLSNGMMFALQDDFADSAPLDAAYAQTRQKWERLYEATQIKGDGEAHPMLSTEDEFADYETWDMGNLDFSEAKTPEMLPAEYARSGLQRGLLLKEQLGTNPFKFGMVGGTDSHTSLSTTTEDNFFGKVVAVEPTADPIRFYETIGDIGGEPSVAQVAWQTSAAGLTAVWAHENTREAVWDAMARKEVFATTGTRLRVRVFAGYAFDAADLPRADFAAYGYANGVPMGGDLAAAPEGKAPGFVIRAPRDYDGANLDRIQVVKGWLDAAGTTHERVYDAAWSDDRVPGANGALPPVGNTVDVPDASFTNAIGAPYLAAFWPDPDFDPAQRAFYYVRVLEIPTPRWTTYDAKVFGVDIPEGAPTAIQERAYTSPIWYTPEG